MSVPIEISAKIVTYFNKQSVISPLLRHERRALSRSGAYVAEVARKSIKKKNRRSKPGEVPVSHTGKLRRMIGSGVDSNRVCAVVGPLLRTDVLNNGKTPSVLEYGGQSKIDSTARKNLRIGSRAKLSDSKNAKATTIKNEKQLRKALEVSKGFKDDGKPVIIQPRPYMSRALIQSDKYIARFFGE